MFDYMFSHFHTIPVCDGHTDKQTDRIVISISRIAFMNLNKHALKSIVVIYRRVHNIAFLQAYIYQTRCAVNQWQR